MANYIDKLNDQDSNVIYPVTLTKAVYKEGTSSTVDDLLAAKVSTTGNETISGVKTFNQEAKFIAGKTNVDSASGIVCAMKLGRIQMNQSIMDNILVGNADASVSSASSVGMKIQAWNSITNTNPDTLSDIAYISTTKNTSFTPTGYIHSNFVTGKATIAYNASADAIDFIFS